MKINDFPELISLSTNDFVLCWDAETQSTRKISFVNLEASFRTPENISLTGIATASSQYNSSFAPSFAIDGNTSTDWASLSQSNPWIRVTWSEPKTVRYIRIGDRPNTNEAANGGTLTFSDGSTVTVTGIPDNGTLLRVDFPIKSGITWVEFQVVGGTGANVGLCEFQAWGY